MAEYRLQEQQENLAMPFPTADKWTDGIYFGLDEELYHSLPWCGSSNIKTLYSSPPDFWFDSPMNPLREMDQPSFAQTLGKALHHRILYGAEAFERDYVWLDDEAEDGDTVSAKGLIKFIKDNGATPEKLKADNEKFIAEELRVKLLTKKIYEKVMVSSAMIVKNPHLAQAFIGGWPEVSIFWHEEGIPCKCRLDYLKLKAIVDLKSFSAKQRINTIDRWVLQDMFNYRYDIQVAHYHNGRNAARQLLADGKVYGDVRPTDEWLAKALKDEQAGWVFVFFKSDGMPISKSYQIPFGSPAHASGRFAVATAYRNYQTFMEKFGTDAWVNVDEPFEITEEDMPKWL
jgi:hypothetical protein